MLGNFRLGGKVDELIDLFHEIIVEEGILTQIFLL